MTIAPTIPASRCICAFRRQRCTRSMRCRERGCREHAARSGAAGRRSAWSGDLFYSFNRSRRWFSTGELIFWDAIALVILQLVWLIWF